MKSSKQRTSIALGDGLNALAVRGSGLGGVEAAGSGARGGERGREAGSSAGSGGSSARCGARSSSGAKACKEKRK